MKNTTMRIATVYPATAEAPKIETMRILARTAGRAIAVPDALSAFAAGDLLHGPAGGRRERFRATGAEYLLKPLDQATLISAIKRMIERR